MMTAGTEENEEFAIHGEGGDYIKIVFAEVHGFPNETCHWGGYDMRAIVKIKAEAFQVDSAFYTSTGEFYNLYKQLITCNKQLSGIAKFTSCEDNLDFGVEYGIGGHIDLTGKFMSGNECRNELRFAIATDQSYVNKTIVQMGRLFAKYGDETGVRG